MIALPKTLKEWFSRVTAVYGLSPENAPAILFPLMLATLSFFGPSILSLFIVMDEIIVVIGFRMSFFLISISGVISSIKREIPGQPQIRGTLRAVFTGIIIAFLFFGGFLATFFTK